MKISIFGLGYVGCVSLGCLAQNGHETIGIDVNDTKVMLINEGKSPIVEKEIDAILFEQHKLGRISATRDGIAAVQNTEMSFICVGTPPTTNGHLDHTAIYKVSQEIAEGIHKKEGFHVVVIRSTVLPGTNRKVREIIGEKSGKNVDGEFAVVSNPEFLREGTAVRDFYNPPFTLIGSNNDNAIARMKAIYETINSPLVVVDVKIAEMIKYVNNAFHALKVTFANEIGNVCKAMQIDSHELMEIFCMDKKLNLSPSYLKPGFSYGGSCLPKDLRAFRTIAHDNYISSPLLETIERSNEYQKELVLRQIMGFEKQNIGFLGLSFKAGTDDLRESPVVDVIERLLGKGYSVAIYDKNVSFSKLIGKNRDYIVSKIPFISKFIVDDPEEIIKASEVIVVVNEEPEFPKILEKLCDDKIIYDLVNIRFASREERKNYRGIAW